MGQVPSENTYLLVGDGKLANHLHSYFQQLGVFCQPWARSLDSKSKLQNLLSESSHVLLCISDDAIEGFYKEYRSTNCQFVHFSGALEIQGVLGFHPLMTFGKEPYDLKLYESMAFVGSKPIQLFQECFPFLKNNYFEISVNEKKKYHGLCTLAGNGTTLLWEILLKEANQLGIAREAFLPFLEKTTQNILNNDDGRFTGPWYRGDFDTIEKHLATFFQTKFDSLYRSFLDLAQRKEQKL